MALIDAEEVRRILYKMMEYDIAHVQEVPRGSDYAPAKTFYLWHVNLSRVFISAEENVLRSILKLKQRLVAEKEKYRFVLEKRSGLEQDPTGIVLSSAEKALLSKFTRTENVLRANIHRMAGIYTVLHFYHK